MANAVTIQTLEDGPRNAVIKIVGILDTSDVSVTDLVDPASLSAINPSTFQTKATQLAIKKIEFNVEDTLSLRLWWDATSDVLIETYVGRGDYDYTQVGFLQNNAGAGKTGKIQYSTQGWANGGVLEFSATLWLIKQGTWA